MNHNLHQTAHGTLEVSAEILPTEYLPIIDKKVREYARIAQVPGFRPGHVPTELIKKRFIFQILKEEVLPELFKYVYNVLNNQPIVVWHNPVSMVNNPLAAYRKTAPITINSEYAIIPMDAQIPIFEPNARSFTSYQVTINEEKIDEQVNHIKQIAAKKTEIFEGPIESDDMLFVQFTEVDEQGNPIKDGFSNEIPLTMGLFTPETRQSLLALNIGDSVVWNDFFDHWLNKDQNIIASKVLTAPNAKAVINPIACKIQKVKRIILSDNSNEEFYRSLGIDVANEEELRTKIKDDILKDCESHNKQLLFSKIFNSLCTLTLGPSEEFFKKIIELHLTKDMDKDMTRLEYNMREKINYLRQEFVFICLEKISNSSLTKKDIEQYATAKIISQLNNLNIYHFGNDLINNLIAAEYEKAINDNEVKETLRNQKILEWASKKVNLTYQNVSLEEFKSILENNNNKRNHKNITQEENILITEDTEAVLTNE